MSAFKAVSAGAAGAAGAGAGAAWIFTAFATAFSVVWLASSFWMMVSSLASTLFSWPAAG